MQALLFPRRPRVSLRAEKVAVGEIIQFSDPSQLPPTPTLFAGWPVFPCSGMAEAHVPDVTPGKGKCAVPVLEFHPRVTINRMRAERVHVLQAVFKPQPALCEELARCVHGSGVAPLPCSGHVTQSSLSVGGRWGVTWAAES